MPQTDTFSNKDLLSTTIYGYAVALSSLQDCIAYCLQRLHSGQSTHVVTLNPEILMAAKQLPNYAHILHHAQLRIPDGIGLVWALKRRGITTTRLAGIEFCEALLTQAALNGLKVAIIGANPEVLQKTHQALENRLTGLKLVYSHHGYFNNEQAPAIFEACKQTQPDIVLLALGFPRQDEWIAEHQPKMDKPTVMVGVGGSFDVWSGSKKRAPKLFRLLNAEWVWRISSEPWRLKRTLNTLPYFFWKAVILNDNSL